jgi:hypothetical protein
MEGMRFLHLFSLLFFGKYVISAIVEQGAIVEQDLRK